MLKSLFVAWMLLALVVTTGAVRQAPPRPESSAVAALTQEVAGLTKRVRDLETQNAALTARVDALEKNAAPAAKKAPAK